MRMTRAALRAQAQELDLRQHDHSSEPVIHEDFSDHHDSSPNSSDGSSRPALRDITDENYPKAEDSVTPEQEQAAMWKSTRSQVKNRASPKVDNVIRISLRSTEELPQNIEQEEVEEPLPIPEDPKEHEEPETPNTKTPARTLRRTTPMSFRSKTPKFDPEVHAATDHTVEAVGEDSFVNSIKTRSPSKHSQSQLEITSQDKYPFVGDDSSETSSRRSSGRIEDSVEAIDALEDAIEKFTENLPTFTPSQKTTTKPLSNQSTTSLKAVTPPKKQIGSTAISPRATGMAAQAVSPSQRSSFKDKVQTPQVSPTRAESAVKARKTSPMKVASPVKAREQSPSKPTSALSARSSIQPSKPRCSSANPPSRPASRPLSMMKLSGPKIEETSAKPGMSFSSSPPKQNPNVVKKRVTSGGVLSTSKPGFVPAKSAKPVTTSTFVLPGEAVAAKLKAQREERLQREQQPEPAKPKAFKARPAPKAASAPTIVPKENRLSKARTSSASTGTNKENVAPKPNLSVTKTRPVTKPATEVKTSSSVRRTTPPQSKEEPAIAPVKPSAPTHARLESMSNGEKLTVTKEDAAKQKVKGKEAFGRIRASFERLEAEKREKEEAARKARAEAAERGRQASREWAEKQKKKLAQTGNGDAISNTST